MKKTSRAWTPLLLLALTGFAAACTDDGDAGVGAPGGGGNAGSAGAGGSGTAGSGGTTGSAGATGSAGSAGDDAAGGAGGTAGTGGTTGAGGTSDSGQPDGTGTGGSDGGDGAVTDGGPTTITKSSGTWVVFADPYGDAGGDAGSNPISSAIMGTAEAFALSGGRMRLVLTVTGLPPNRPFGSHLHKLKCDDTKAGGHYQNMPFPDGGSATDPAYANSINEAWLDFTTDAGGAASSETTVSWVPRAGQANAIIIHDMKTGDGGVAGARLACTNIQF